MPKKTSPLKGDLQFLLDSGQSFAQAQVDLLIAINTCGSISKAAKAVGISYKTAWDRIDAMNNLAEQPLVVKSAGGARGGGTALTAFGVQIIEGFQALCQEHQALVDNLGQRLQSLNDVAHFMRSHTVQTSARNQFRGPIVDIVAGDVNAEVTLNISDSQTITAIITNESLQALGLAVGKPVTALIKASWIVLTKETNLKTSARNQLLGRIERVSIGAVNSDIVVDLGDAKSLAATITNTSTDELAFQTGDQVCALFKASSVILMAT